MADILPQQTAYADAWSINADAFERQGCYSWMAKLLEPHRPAKILDIGSGMGHGLLAISSLLNSRIIAIEENLCCFKKAALRLGAAGYTIDQIQRLQYHAHSDKTHTIACSDFEIATNQRISLIQGDLLMEDPLLLQFLGREGPFDAITVWLIGTEPTRAKKCTNLASLRVSEPKDYRNLLQTYVYGLADNLLRPGGLVQVVDRVQAPATEVHQYDFLEMHQELAKQTNLKMMTLEAREYSEPLGAGVGMVSTRNPGVRISPDKGLSMVSIISMKPLGGFQRLIKSLSLWAVKREQVADIDVQSASCPG